MYRFSQSKIIPYQDCQTFAQRVANEFDFETVNIRWRDKCPESSEEILVRAISPDTVIASSLWRSFRFIDLFAGIGGVRLGFEAVGGQCVFSSEWDELAQQTYQSNFGEKPVGDITKIETAQIPDHDILLAGFPCQPFSIIGKQEGFADTRGTLFFEIERILRDKKPTAFLLENVKQFRTHDNGRTCKIVLDKLRELGYHTHITVLNALNFGVAQKRERTIIVGFLEPLTFCFPNPYPYRPDLKDILEKDNEVDKKLFASDMICKKRLERLKEQGQTPFYPSMWHENKGGHIGIHPFSCALRHNASYNYLLVNGNRRPTGREMLRFQGFPETFKITVPHSAIRAQAGNSVAVPVITAVAAEMIMSLRNKKITSPPQIMLEQQFLFSFDKKINHGIKTTIR
ncbi:MAG: DNA (cytosine-5-)-methyltransferase [Planctomycetaceae bacterium]|nr:DNA (cytosine-5-)-methyltransferase [Planctomycetaceae bacterium]